MSERFILGTSNEEEPFREGEVISYTGKAYIVCSNDGDGYGTVKGTYRYKTSNFMFNGFETTRRIVGVYYDTPWNRPSLPVHGAGQSVDESECTDLDPCGKCPICLEAYETYSLRDLEDEIPKPDPDRYLNTIDLSPGPNTLTITWQGIILTIETGNDNTLLISHHGEDSRRSQWPEWLRSYNV